MRLLMILKLCFHNLVLNTVQLAIGHQELATVATLATLATPIPILPILPIPLIPLALKLNAHQPVQRPSHH